MPTVWNYALHLLGLGTALLIAANPLCAEELPALQSWQGQIKDEALLQDAPESKIILNTPSWQQLWRRWRGDESLPPIDFAHQLVIVETSSGPNHVAVQAQIDPQGDLRWVARSTLAAGPGFGYQLLTVSRDKVQSVNGQPLTRRGVFGQLTIPAEVPAFDGRTFLVQLWEYDPRLADVGAECVGELRLDGIQHESGEPTRLDFALGSQLHPREDRRYYLTAFLLQDQQRTHIAEAGERPGLCHVLAGEPWSSVALTVRPVR